MKPLVTLMIPFGSNPSPEWCFSFADILPPMNGSMYRTKLVNAERGFARTKLCYDAWKRGSKFGQFLDADNTVPANMIRMLMFELENADPDVMVIGGIYTTKTLPPVPLVYKTIGDGPFYRWKLGEVFPVELVATGMMMIRMELFDNLEDPRPIVDKTKSSKTHGEIIGFDNPWFKEIRGVEEAKHYGLLPEDYKGSEFLCNDDGFFCHKVISAGYKILAHGGCLGLHWDDKGTAYCLPDNSYAIKHEMLRRFSVAPSSQDEYVERLMEVYRSIYGYSEFTPKEDTEETLKKLSTGA